MVRVGDRGITATPLRPGGVVIVHGTRHSARCPAGFVETATDIVIVGGDNHGLIVHISSAVGNVTELPNIGMDAYSSFGDKIKRTGNAGESAREADWRKAVRFAWWWGALVGAAAGAACGWQQQSQNVLSLWPVVFVLAGTAWGAILARILCGVFDQVGGRSLLVLTAADSLLTMAGASNIFTMVHPRSGLLVAIASALCTTCLLGGVLPVIVMVGEWMGSSEEGNADSAPADADATRSSSGE